MVEEFDPILVRNFAIALFIGALIGIEREKKKSREDPHTIGGIRTFILLAQAGAVSAWISVHLGAPWVFAATVAAVAAAIVAGYVAQTRVHPEGLGLTTEVAAVCTVLLGGVCLYGAPGIAVALGITTSAVLAFKQPIHGLVDKIGLDDIYAGLKLLFATFIVLPLLPDRTIDPWGAINPYRAWWLVILISSLSLVGYVAVRLLGRQIGTALTGLFGGLVSSTAVTLTFARKSREEDTPYAATTLAAGLLIAWAVMFLRIIVLVAVIHPPLVAPLLAPMAAMGVAAGAAAAVGLTRASRDPAGRFETAVPLANPFSLAVAVKFAALLTLVFLVVKVAQQEFEGRGVLAVAALAGLTDVDAITLSMATDARDGGRLTTAAAAVAIAAVSNTLVKCALVAWLGTRGMTWRVVGATVIALGAGAVAFALGGPR